MHIDPDQKGRGGAETAGGVPGFRAVTYNAFMSCTHAADGMLAPALQSALHRFAKPGIGCARCISSDKTTLAVTPRLWRAIQAALDQSRHTIVQPRENTEASLVNKGCPGLPSPRFQIAVPFP